MNVPDILLIKEDRTLRWVVEALNQLDDGRLPRPRRSHNGSRIASLDLKRSILENRLVLWQSCWVLESYVVKVNVLIQSKALVSRAGLRAPDFGHSVDDVKYELALDPRGRDDLDVRKRGN